MATVPGVPTDVALIVLSPASINVTWVAPADDGGADITSYIVGRLNTANLTLTTKNVGLVLTYNDTDLTERTTYVYAVKAVNSEGESDSSTSAQATTIDYFQTTQDYLNTQAGTVGLTKQQCLVRLAGVTDLNTAQDAANKYASVHPTRRTTAGALNIKVSQVGMTAQDAARRLSGLPS
jgi:hypothetical protein